MGCRRILAATCSLASLGRGVARTAAEKASQSAAFFRDLGPAVGVSSPDMMRLVSTKTDRLGKTHLTYKQAYRGVPVFGATMKTHFDAAGRLEAVGGTAIPDIAVSTVPTWSRERAAAVARASVAAARGDSEYLRDAAGSLVVFREGLARGVPGNNYLAWEIEITDGGGVRDVVYVDAHGGTSTTSTGTTSTSTPSTTRAPGWTPSSTAATAVPTRRGTAPSSRSAPASPPTTSPRTSGRTPTPSTRTA